MKLNWEPEYLSQYSDELRVARPVFDYWQGQKIFFQFRSVQTGSEADLPSYPVSTCISIHRGKAVGV